MDINSYFIYKQDLSNLNFSSIGNEYHRQDASLQSSEATFMFRLQSTKNILLRKQPRGARCEARAFFYSILVRASPFLPSFPASLLPSHTKGKIIQARDFVIFLPQENAYFSASLFPLAQNKNCVR